MLTADKVWALGPSWQEPQRVWAAPESLAFEAGRSWVAHFPWELEPARIMARPGASCTTFWEAVEDPAARF